jgi:hypothetical protein
MTTVYTLEYSMNGKTEKIPMPLRQPKDYACFLPSQRSFLERYLPNTLIMDVFYLMELANQASLYQNINLSTAMKKNLVLFKKRVQSLFGVRSKDFSEIADLETRGGDPQNKKVPFQNDSDYIDFAAAVDKAYPLWKFVREKAKQTGFDAEDARMIKQRADFNELARECLPVPDALIRRAFNPQKRGLEVQAKGLALAHTASLLGITGVGLETLNAAYKRGKRGEAK